MRTGFVVKQSMSTLSRNPDLGKNESMLTTGASAFESIWTAFREWVCASFASLRNRAMLPWSMSPLSSIAFVSILADQSCKSCLLLLLLRNIAETIACMITTIASTDKRLGIIFIQGNNRRIRWVNKTTNFLAGHCSSLQNQCLLPLVGLVQLAVVIEEPIFCQEWPITHLSFVHTDPRKK